MLSTKEQYDLTDERYDLTDERYDLVIRIQYPNLVSAILAKNNIKDNSKVGKGLVLMKIEPCLKKHLYLGFSVVHLRG